MDTRNHFFNWEWFNLKENDIKTIHPIPDSYPGYDTAWFQQYKGNKTNELSVTIAEFGERIVKGSLVYQQGFKNENDYRMFHFYLTKQLLVTVDFDPSLLKTVNQQDLLWQMKTTSHAVTGFLILLREILTQYLNGIDNFEVKHRELMWKIHQINQTSTLEDIYKCRHELMIWKGLLIPLNDLTLGIEELYLEEVSGEIEFKQTCKRLERAFFLTNEYQKELDTLINMENVISTHRGNEIMKTLTVMTILFTPVMAWGALWGMNFRYMPELNWSFGYLLSLFIIVITTFGLHWYLKMRGWTGDILKGKKKGSFFK